MEISSPGSNTTTQKFQEGTLVKSISEYIKETNFPKKLLLKKLDLLIDKKKTRILYYSDLLKKAREANSSMDKQISVLKKRNSKELQDLIRFLS